MQLPKLMNRIISLFALLVSIASANAQKLETSADYPTGYITTSYYSEGNTIKSIDGVLYMVYGDVPVALVKYPAMNEREVYEVPSTVRRICNNAFQGTRYLKTLRLHSVVTGGNFLQLNIGETAFNDSSIENFEVISNNHPTALNEPTLPAAAPAATGAGTGAADLARYDLAGRPTPAASDARLQIVRSGDSSRKEVRSK